MRAISGKNTAFFPYAAHADTVRAAYQWALQSSKRKQIAHNAMSSNDDILCMHYTSRRGVRHFVGVFPRDAMKRLRSCVWYGNRTSLQSPKAKRGPTPLHAFELSRKLAKALFEGRLKNPASLLCALRVRSAWGTWCLVSRTPRLRTAFSAWKTSGFVIL